MKATSNEGDKSVHGHALTQQTLKTLQGWLSADAAPDPELAAALLVHYVIEIIAERRGVQAVAALLETAVGIIGTGGEA